MSIFTFPFCFPQHFPQQFVGWWNQALSFNNPESQAPQMLNLKNEEKQKKPIDEEVRTKQTQISHGHEKKSKMIVKTSKKKYRHTKKSSKDEEFRQRQQTANRNLCSNTLKVYFKQLRDQKSETFRNLTEIIRVHDFEFQPQMFVQQINKHFPKQKNYIIPDKLFMLCHPTSTSEDTFAKILRISMKRFFEYEIYCVNIKSVRTTRKIRNLQIRQGRSLMQELFE